ncbi:MAG: RNA polymerase subunit sigma-24 [Spirochaetales bacterium]|nr:RNA polymerase subunit sigma-24 [Spirochaetales bacterium]
MMNEMDNDQWLSSLQSQDSKRDEAISRLREHLVKSLRAGLRSWKRSVGSQYNELVEDSVQDALVKVLNNLKSFRGESRFTTWAAKIAIRTALTELRRKKWNDVSLDEITSKVDSMMRSVYPNPEQSAVRNDLMSSVMSIMNNELTQRQQTALKAVMFGGMPLEEAARRLNTNRNALYKLLHDARLRMKEGLEKQGMSPAEVLSSFEKPNVRSQGNELS